MSTTANGMINYDEWLRCKHYQARPIRTALRTLRPDTFDEGLSGETERVNTQFYNALNVKTGHFAGTDGLIEGDKLSLALKWVMLAWFGLNLYKAVFKRR